MRIFEHSPMRERRWLWLVALFLSLALATSGCSQIKAWWSPDDDSTDLDDAFMFWALEAGRVDLEAERRR